MFVHQPLVRPPNALLLRDVAHEMYKTLVSDPSTVNPLAPVIKSS
jgi:hypothetical protein